MGVCLRYFKMPMGWATGVFIVLVGVAISLGRTCRSTWQS